MLQDLCEVTRSINFAKSQDSQSECCSPRLTFKNGEKFKCFKCYGSNNYNCPQCSGTQKVSGSNPMAMLLNNILMKKISARRQEEKDDYQSVEAIKEVEEDNDDRKMTCSFCRIEFEELKVTSSQNISRNLCSQCSQKHEGNLLHCNWIDGKPMTTSLGAVSSQNDRKYCHSCQNKIENCYSVCRTCQSNKSSFWICDVCTNDENYQHSETHLLEIVYDYDTLKDNKLETYSEDFQEEFQTFSIQSQKIQDSELPKHKLKLRHQNSSIANVLDTGDDSPLLRQISDNVKQEDQISRVRFELDGLFSSYDFNQSMKSKNILRPPSVMKQQGFSCTASEASKSKEKNKENDNKSHEDVHQYTFFGYKCDICDIQPIKNVKYHCNDCEDFDVCDKCYECIEQLHEHTYFQKEVGRQIKEKVFERISNCRETSMRTTVVPKQNKQVRSHFRSKTHRFNTLLN